MNLVRHKLERLAFVAGISAAWLITAISIGKIGLAEAMTFVFLVVRTP